MKKFFITTPIYYPNARPHVGSAYTTIVCDAIARYKRMCGYDVAFLTGTDEHGEKLQRAAEAEGKSPAEFVAEKRKLFTKLWDTLGIPQHSAENPVGYRFVHTSQNPAHVKSVHWMIRQAQKAGYIGKRKYEGRYCIYDERYVSDSTEPANCDICGRPAELISEENYFFKLSAFQERLLKLYEEQPDFVRPDFRMNEVKSFVKSGLRDISISRKRLKWGVPWPDDPDQVVYVWYDALTSYLTGIGFRGSEKPEPDFEKYWMDPDAERVHMIGKDILRFHAVYWPAFLWAAGLPLPNTIFAHGWIYYERDKMSKSKGNVVYPEPIVEALNSLGAPGNDALRYYLLRDTTFGLDASFSYDGLIQRYNSDLANGLGNLASRTLTMLQQFRGGVMPEGPVIAGQQDLFPLGNLIQGSRDAFDCWNLSGALAISWDFITQADKLIVEWKPWELGKSNSSGDKEKFCSLLYSVIHLLRAVSILVSPSLHQSTEMAWRQLGENGKPADHSLANADAPPRVGTILRKPGPIFPRLDMEATIKKLEEFAAADRGTNTLTKKGTTVEQQPEQKPVPETAAAGSESRAPSPEHQAPSPQAPAPSPDAKIGIEDFAKVEMRVGEVLAAERIPKADKLLKLQVDIGTEVRQVCAGIAQYYEPEKLVGMKVVVVTNLAPRKLRGVESNGMIVAASVGEEGRPVLATFAEDVPKGSKLR